MYKIYQDTLQAYIAPEALDSSMDRDALAFGKPVWDFKYPESSFFITRSGLIGCSISVARAGDVVCAPLGSTYPLVLRPEGDYFTIRGCAYVPGAMRGEMRSSQEVVFRIR